MAEKAGQGGYDADPAMDLSLFKTSSSGLTGKSLAMAVEMGKELGVPLQFGALLIALMQEARGGTAGEPS